MNTTDPTTAEAKQALRERAEYEIRATGETKAASPGQDLEATLEDLQVHEVELEMQNEDLRSSRAALELSQRRYFQHFDIAPVGMVRLSDKGHVREANILGGQMLGSDLRLLFAGHVAFVSCLIPGCRQTFRNHIARAIKTDSVESCEVALRQSDSGKLWVRLQSVAFQADDGPLELFVSMTDLTEHNAAEAKRLELERELLKKQHLESLEKLAGRIGHALNDCLHVIYSNLEILASAQDEGASHAECAGNAHRAARRATSMARRLLLFSKEASPDMETVDIAEMLGLAVTIALSGSKLKVRFDIAPDVKHISADPSHFSQIIENLVLNAGEASPMGGELLVRASNCASGGESDPFHPDGRVKIEIVDSGCGFPANLQERIFEPCFTTKRGAAGIGLTVVAKLMQQHGGTIEVKSREGQGTTAILFFPAAAGTIREKRPPLPAAKAAAGASKGRVLLIDENDLIRKIAPLVLHNLGYEGAVNQDGVEGCEAYLQAKREGVPFDALIIDGMIIGQPSARKALKHLLEQDPDANVILCGGSLPSELHDKAKQLNIKGCLPKPFHSEELGALLDQLLK